MTGQRIPGLLLLLFITGNAAAETAYVTSQLQIGLHADKTISSPVVKIVATGTPLELIKTEDKLTFVRTADGVEGWVDNSYLTQNSTVSLPGLAAEGIQPPSGGGGSLEQELKSERVKTGELQVQIAELRKRLGQNGNNDSLYEKIDQLTVEKKKLEIQMAQLLENAGQPAIELLPENAKAGSFYTPRNLLITLIVALIAGVIAGLYLMDYLYRRRHGGFRV